jgi:hypothetical protein
MDGLINFDIRNSRWRDMAGTIIHTSISLFVTYKSQIIRWKMKYLYE